MGKMEIKMIDEKQLIEKASFKREIGYMIALGPNATKVLDEFGEFLYQGKNGE
jgi:hypothetical protein